MYNLKGLRKEVNKTQSEIAVLFGCKQNNISMQEKSDRDLTTEQMDVLRKNFGEEIVNKYYYKISTSNVETINNERESTLKSSIHRQCLFILLTFTIGADDSRFFSF